MVGQSPQALLLAVLRVIHAAHNSVRIRDFLNGQGSSVTKILASVLDRGGVLWCGL